ncbi:MAG: DUF4325 domain-containing protein [Candidatus Omnitrophota bacterium]
MDITKSIMQLLEKKKEVKVSDLTKLTGFSRVYINRFFQRLREEGKIVLIGKANKARYIIANEENIKEAKKTILRSYYILNNLDLSEDIILDKIKNKTSIFVGISENVSAILGYAFTEMLNNAIEHSESKKIEVVMDRDDIGIRFSVRDKGIGIYNNIIKKKGLKNESEAIQDLIKGKLSTQPKSHSGEGIFFTSKAADILRIQSSTKKLIFDNIVQDIFIKDINKFIGTKVFFSISLDSKRKLRDIFNAYADDSFKFTRTKVIVKLYKMTSEYISRSQARRLLTGLDKFEEIILDFDGVETVGQGFADEVFRVWKSNNRNKNIIYKNTNENVEFMIKRALKKDQSS